MSLKIESESFGNISTAEEVFSSDVMTYDNQTGLLEFRMSPSYLSDLESPQKIKFILTDSSVPKSIKEVVIEINILKEISAFVSPLSVIDIDLEANETIEEDTLTSKIDKVSNLAKIRIRFSEEMQTEYLNKSCINSTVLDIYVKPSNDWHLYDENFDANTTLNFTWEVETFEKDLMDLILNFTNPL